MTFLSTAASVQCTLSMENLKHFHTGSILNVVTKLLQKNNSISHDSTKKSKLQNSVYILIQKKCDCFLLRLG